MNDVISWPPPFSVKKSARARHVRLQATVQRGLELIVPMRFNHQEIPVILQDNKSWIEKQLATIQQTLSNLDAQALPAEIHLPVPDQLWKIVYLKTDQVNLRLFQRQSNELVLFGDINNKMQCKKLLSRWVRKQACIHLPQRLAALSQKIQLPYCSVSIRNQRTRWGSCTAKKAINLNYKLVFLRPNLVEHILIHELCHTVHLNHSIKFWQLVARFDPAWRAHNREIKSADHHIPLWLS